MLWLLLLTFINTCSALFTSEKVYPSPNATGEGGWETALTQAKALTAKMTLAEKIWMVTGVEGPCVGNIPGIERLGFKGLCLQDGPLAIRQATYASVFPAGLACGASWDKRLIYQRGVELGQEFKAKGANVGLGPSAGPLGRSPYGGRNWEGFSPDPYLSGIALNLTVTGMQSSGLQACAKHFIGNEQETQRSPSQSESGETIYSVSSNIDDRTMHELYLWPFADAIKGNLSSIMCSLNMVNNTYACENSKILNGLLKEELGFQGWVVSDWDATHSCSPAVLSGQDMTQPGVLRGSVDYWGPNLTQAVQNGSVPESRLDDMVHRILTPFYFQGQDLDDYPTVDPDTGTLGFGSTTYDYVFNIGNSSTAHRDVRGNHASLIRELGAASAVLLKNEQETLPLESPKHIALFGNDMADFTDGAFAPEAKIGALAVGGGSGSGRFTYMVPPLEAIKAKANSLSPPALVTYVIENDQVASNIIYSKPNPDVCIVFLKSYSSEGNDRTRLLPDDNGTELVQTVSDAGICGKIIVVTHTAGLILMPWADNPNVTAIIAGHLPGQEVGNSLVDVLWGVANPSGKLPYTVAYNASQYNGAIENATGTNDPHGWQSTFTEGLFIDYRHFDARNITPRYPFGFGLSYTNFELSDIKKEYVHPNLTAYPSDDGKAQPGGKSELWDVVASVSVTVHNIGKLAGSEVPQLYLSFPKDEVPLQTPRVVLRGFEKTHLLEPGEKETISFLVRRRDVSFWDVVAQDWKVPKGEITARVGTSSRDLPFSTLLQFR